MKNVIWLAAAAVGLVSVPASAVTGSAAAGLQAMRELNLISLGNLVAMGGEIEGKAFVGGNVTGNSFQVGFGSSANPLQGLAQSARATWTVGGAQQVNINLNNGSNGGKGLIGDFGATTVYGAAIGGNLQSINLNATGGVVRVGGDLQNNMNVGAGTSLFVTGSAVNGLNLSNNVTVGIGGNAGTIQGGQNGVVRVNGNVSNLGIGSGGTAQIGGSLNQLSGSNRQTVAVVGNINGGNLGSNSDVKAGGSISNLNGASNAAVHAGGSITGNANGASYNANFVWTGAIAAPTAPGVPAAPDIASQTAQLTADLRSLSTALSERSILANPSSISWTGGTQRATFNAVDNGAGYALFNVGASIFQAQEIAYNFVNLTVPVIINVSGASSYFMQSNFINNAQLNNQQVIWNFVDATQVTFDRKHQGSILAPLASVQARLVEGTVVAANYTMGDEVHLGAYSASNMVLPAPEPGVWAMLVVGFGLVGAMMRRKGARVIA